MIDPRMRLVPLGRILGPMGPVGPGVAMGGEPGQVLIKAGVGDYEVQWGRILVIDNLTSTSAIDPLSANQGRILNQNLINHIGDNVRHITQAERVHWNSMTPLSVFNDHVENLIHITEAERYYWNTKENALPADGAVTSFLRGDKSWQDFISTVRLSTLAALTLSNSAVVIGDTVQIAMGKLQAQVNARVGGIVAGTGLSGGGTPTTGNAITISHAAHTGEVTGTTSLTITNGAVINARLANMITNTVKGRITAGTGVPEDINMEQLREMISSPNHTFITEGERQFWNNMTPYSTFEIHITDTGVHITPAERNSWNSREPGITPGTTDQFWRGDKTWQNFGNNVRATLIASHTLTNSAIVNTDSYQVAMGKLQAQVSARSLTGHVHDAANVNTGRFIAARMLAAGSGFLRGNGATADPSYNAVRLNNTSDISGTLAQGNGGTGHTTLTAALHAIGNI